MVYKMNVANNLLIRFELALNGALWYIHLQFHANRHIVLNLPSTGHYGINYAAVKAARSSFELALNGALWYTDGVHYAFFVGF